MRREKRPRQRRVFDCKSRHSRALPASGVVADMSQQQPESFLRAFELPLRKTQAHNLALAVGALLERRRCTITQPARALPDGRPCHRIKRIWRFLDNQRVNPLVISQRLAGYVGRWRAQGRLPIFVDDTVLRHNAWVLTFALEFRRRALPLLALAFNPPRIRKSLWKLRVNATVQVWQALGAHARRAVLLGDRGFASTQFFRDLQQLRVNFVIRVPAKVIIRWHGFRQLLLQLDLQPGMADLWLQGVRYGPKQGTRVNLLAAWRPGHREPWLLVTTLVDPRLAYELYAQRMRVEQLFRDAKSHFGLRRTRLTTTDRLSRLLMVVTLALWWLAFVVRRIAKAFEALVRGRGALSFVSLGLEWLRRRRRRTDKLRFSLSSSLASRSFESG